MTDKREIKEKKKKLHLAVLAGVAVLVLGTAGGTARYIHQEKESENLEAKSFYFTSDWLDKTEKTYTLSPGTTEVTIKLKNYADELRWSDTDIEYSYSVKKKTTEVDKGTGKIIQNKNSGSSSEIQLSNLTAGKYEVVVNAESPYTETLKGIFVIPEESDEIVYSVSDSSGSPYAILTVSVKNYDGKIKISWSDGVIPDNTQENFAEIKNWTGTSYQAGNVQVTLGKYSSDTYRFFKSDPTKDYSKADQIAAEKVK